MKDPNCAYCMQGDLVAAFAYPICQMNTGYLYLFKEQSKKIRPAVVQLMAEADEIAKSGKATSLDELFGTEDS